MLSYTRKTTISYIPSFVCWFCTRFVSLRESFANKLTFVVKKCRRDGICFFSVSKHTEVLASALLRASVCNAIVNRHHIKFYFLQFQETNSTPWRDTVNVTELASILLTTTVEFIKIRPWILSNNLRFTLLFLALHSLLSRLFTICHNYSCLNLVN